MADRLLLENGTDAYLLEDSSGVLLMQFSTPADLFAASESGVFYDISDLSTLWQDTAGTVAVTTDGDPVARVDDKSGNGNHLLKIGADSTRPLYKTDGAGHWLEFDGSDDYLRTAFAAAFTQSWDRITGIRQISWTQSDQIFSGAPDTGVIFQNSATPQIELYDGGVACANTSLAVGTNGVLSDRHDGASSSITVNNGTASTGNPGSNLPSGLTVAANVGGGGNANIRLYSLVQINRLLTADEMAATRDWTTGKIVANVVEQISGSTSPAFTTAGILRGAGALSGAVSVAFTASSTGQAVASAQGSATVAFSTSGAITGAGALSGSVAPAFTASGALGGVGALSGSTNPAFSTAGALAGSGSLAGSSSAVFTSSGSIAGLASISGSASGSFTASANLAGIGYVSGVITATFSTSATMLAGESELQVLMRRRRFMNRYVDKHERIGPR